MPLKKSYFNPTLFRKNLARFWPLWGVPSLLGALIPLYLQLHLMTNWYYVPDAGSFADTLYQSVTIFAPAFTLCYAAACAWLVWNYLFSPRSVGLMHTLPVSRTCLFLTNALSGLVMIAIPYAVVGGLVSFISVFWGFFSLNAVLCTVFAVICMALLFFGLATLCAMLTGHAAALPALYLLLNFLSYILESLMKYLASCFLFGVSTGEADRFRFLSPVIQIYYQFHTAFSEEPGFSAVSGIVYGYSDNGAAERILYLDGFGTVALYGLAGIALLALAWVLYRKRRSECAGDVAAQRPLRPVFRYGLALLSALTLGQVFYEFLWDSVFRSGYGGAKADFIPMTVCLALAGAIGYYAASMLLEKSLRVFRGSWKGLLCVCAASFILCGAASADLTGLEDKIPDIDDVSYISVYGSFEGIEYESDTPEGRQITEQVLDIHRAILSDKSYVTAFDGPYNRPYDGPYDGSNTAVGCWLNLGYYLKDGSYLHREYRLPLTGSRVKDPATYDGKLYALQRSEAVQIARVQIPADSLLVSVEVYGGERGVNFDASSGDSSRLYDALLRDAREGNITGGYYDVFDELEGKEPETYLGVTLEIDYAQNGRVRARSVELREGMANTIAELVAEGFYAEGELTPVS